MGTVYEFDQMGPAPKKTATDYLTAQGINPAQVKSLEKLDASHVRVIIYCTDDNYQRYSEDGVNLLTEPGVLFVNTESPLP
jgi:hypothetical protein